MATKMKSTKKQRTKKVSKGINGAGGKVRLTELQKALLGGGAMKRIERPAKVPAASSAQDFTPAK